MTNSFIEAIKEPARLVSLAVVSWLLTEGVGAILRAFGGALTPEVQLVIIGVLTSVLKGLDKYLHEIGKVTDNDTLTKGLTQF